MQHHDFRLSVKAVAEDGTFTGLASTYGPPADFVGDIVAPGAFKQSIKQQGAGYPLLWAHDQAQPIGLARVEDSQAGLSVTGKLLLEDPAAARAYAHLKAETIKGMSIGFTLPRGEGKVLYADDGTRTLKEIFLHEISLVAVPANQQARITSVKSLGDVRYVLKSLRDDQVDDDVIADLQAIGMELKRLMAAPTAAADADTVAALKRFAGELRGIVGQ